MQSYVVVSVYAGNWRKDGRTSDKPSAHCRGIGGKKAMTGHRNAIVAHYCEVQRCTEEALTVVVEVLTWEQANARYTLSV